MIHPCSAYVGIGVRTYDAARHATALTLTLADAEIAVYTTPWDALTSSPERAAEETLRRWHEDAHRILRASARPVCVHDNDDPLARLVLQTHAENVLAALARLDVAAGVQRATTASAMTRWMSMLLDRDVLTRALDEQARLLSEAAERAERSISNVPMQEPPCDVRRVDAQASYPRFWARTSEE